MITSNHPFHHFYLYGCWILISTDPTTRFVDPATCLLTQPQQCHPQQLTSTSSPLFVLYPTVSTDLADFVSDQSFTTFLPRTLPILDTLPCSSRTRCPRYIHLCPEAAAEVGP